LTNISDTLTKALVALEDTAIVWSDETERKEITDAIPASYGFSNCCGIVDGTLFPLGFNPRVFREDYCTRKGSYALHT